MSKSNISARSVGLSSVGLSSILVAVLGSACIPGLVKGQFSTSSNASTATTAAPSRTVGPGSPRTVGPRPEPAEVAATPAAKPAEPEEDEYYAKRRRWVEITKPLEPIVVMYRGVESVTTDGFRDLDAAAKYTGAAITAAGQKCLVEYKRADAAGVEYQHEVSGLRMMQIEESCKFMIENGSTYDGRLAKARTEAVAAAKAKVAADAANEKREREREAEEKQMAIAAVAYEKELRSLMSGDKLAFVLDHNSLSGPNQSDLRSPKDFARVSVYFWARQNPNTSWTLFRWQFSGNKLVKETHQGFVVEPGPAAYR